MLAATEVAHMLEPRGKSAGLAAELLDSDGRAGDAVNRLLDGESRIGDDIAMLVVSAMGLGDHADEDRPRRADHFSEAESADLCGKRECDEQKQQRNGEPLPQELTQRTSCHRE